MLGLGTERIFFSWMAGGVTAIGIVIYVREFKWQAGSNVQLGMCDVYVLLWKNMVIEN